MAEKVITEAYLRRLFVKEVPATFSLVEGQILTPSAAQFLSEKRVDVVRVKCSTTDSSPMPSNRQPSSLTGYVAEDGTQYLVKPEHLTHLVGNQLVAKDHPRIIFRGKLDGFQAELLLLQKQLKNSGDLSLAKGLGELLARARAIMRADVLGEEVAPCKFLGLDEDEIRARSHQPQKYFSSAHLVLSAQMDSKVLELNRLRTLVRSVELSAMTAFASGSNPDRIDIVQALNRLSSVIYVMMLAITQLVASTGDNMDSRSIEEIVAKVLAICNQSQTGIPVELSARHVHLSAVDVDNLFGGELTQVRELSQPGQYLCRERIQLVGPSGTLDNVAVLGPARGQTQVEISLSDARIIGATPPLRQSGDVDGSPGVQIVSAQGSVTLNEGLLIPGRHIHMHPDDARNFAVRDKEFVRVRVGDARALVFEEVLVRVNEDYRLAMHIDFDEGNACGCQPETVGILLKGHE